MFDSEWSSQILSAARESINEKFASVPKRAYLSQAKIPTMTPAPYVMNTKKTWKPVFPTPNVVQFQCMKEPNITAYVPQKNFKSFTTISTVPKLSRFQCHACQREH